MTVDTIAEFVEAVAEELGGAYLTRVERWGKSRNTTLTTSGKTEMICGEAGLTVQVHLGPNREVVAIVMPSHAPWGEASKLAELCKKAGVTVDG